MNLLIIKNTKTEGPGLLSTVLREREIGSDMVEYYQDGILPPLSRYSAVIVLGGPQSANDTTEKMKDLIAYTRRILREDIPYFGICLGMQVLARAAGGRIGRCPVKEIGWRDATGEYYRMHLTERGRRDPLLAGIRGPVRLFQLHEEMAEPSVCGEVLAFGDDCPVQLIKEGRYAYGIQGHIEVDEPLLKIIGKTDPGILPKARSSLIPDYQAIRDEYIGTGMTLFSNFLDIIGEI